MANNLEKLYLFSPQDRSYGVPILQWILNNLDRNRYKIIGVFFYAGTNWASKRFSMEAKNYFISMCQRQNFRCEIAYTQRAVEYNAVGGIRNIVTWQSSWNTVQREESNLLHQSCNIWLFDGDNAILRNMSTLANTDAAATPNISGAGTSKEDEAKKIMEQLEENLRLAWKENQDLKLALESVKRERDELEEERNNAMNEVERLLKEIERKEMLHGSHTSLNSEFTLKELEQATQNFDDSLKLGQGGFGCVYKGTLRRMLVAIKKLKPDSMQGMSQFQQEVDVLTRIRHPHLVTLIGSCSEASILVYEFLPNGSLEDRLVCANNTPPLTWQTRTRIIGEICLALIFLHSSKPDLVIHGDLNPHNVLLDANFVSKLGDFGISRLVKQPDTTSTAIHRTSHPAGTFAYSDPEYMMTGELTPKSDIYGLGVIILHLLTGQSALNIARSVTEGLKSGSFESMIDASAGKWPFDQAKRLAEIGLSCAQMSRSSRPDLVTEVWSAIEPLIRHASVTVDENHIPHHFICPILQDIMKNPHLAADGFTYEAEAIQGWLVDGRNTSPMTNLPLPNLELIPNLTLRSAIQEWLELHQQS